VEWLKDLFLDGKRVGIFRTGGSGIQVIEALAGKVETFTDFQQTPNLALSMNQKPMEATQQMEDKEHYP
jgi:cation diffusion facilitator CzcD-associated flavoprotein CzcO